MSPIDGAICIILSYIAVTLRRESGPTVGTLFASLASACIDCRCKSGQQTTAGMIKTRIARSSTTTASKVQAVVCCKPHRTLYQKGNLPLSRARVGEPQQALGATTKHRRFDSPFSKADYLPCPRPRCSENTNHFLDLWTFVSCSAKHGTQGSRSWTAAPLMAFASDTSTLTLGHVIAVPYRSISSNSGGPDLPWPLGDSWKPFETHLTAR
jgi:hypothetical protein